MSLTAEDFAQLSSRKLSLTKELKRRQRSSFLTITDFSNQFEKSWSEKVRPKKLESHYLSENNSLEQKIGVFKKLSITSFFTFNDHVLDSTDAISSRKKHPAIICSSEQIRVSDQQPPGSHSQPVPPAAGRLVRSGLGEFQALPAVSRTRGRLNKRRKNIFGEKMRNRFRCF